MHAHAPARAGGVGPGPSKVWCPAGQPWGHGGHVVSAVIVGCSQYYHTIPGCGGGEGGRAGVWESRGVQEEAAQAVGSTAAQCTGTRAGKAAWGWGQPSAPAGGPGIEPSCAQAP